MIKPISILIPYKLFDNQLHLWCQKRLSKDDLFKLLEFPGGKIEVGESPIDAAKRETFEEVGIEVKKEKIQHFKTYQFEDALTIWAFIYLDDLNLFSEDMYYQWTDLLAVNDKVLPNNIKIINDLAEYFQVFSARHNH